MVPAPRTATRRTSSICMVQVSLVVELAAIVLRPLELAQEHDAGQRRSGADDPHRLEALGALEQAAAGHGDQDAGEYRPERDADSARQAVEAGQGAMLVL